MICFCIFVSRIWILINCFAKRITNKILLLNRFLGHSVPIGDSLFLIMTPSLFPNLPLFHIIVSRCFYFFQWNSTTTYNFEIERDFGTDYGICCWYTPQLNFSAIPDGPDTDWAFWFNSVPRGKSLIYEVSMVLHKLVLLPTYLYAVVSSIALITDVVFYDILYLFKEALFRV